MDDEFKGKKKCDQLARSKYLRVHTHIINLIICLPTRTHIHYHLRSLDPKKWDPCCISGGSAFWSGTLNIFFPVPLFCLGQTRPQYCLGCVPQAPITTTGTPISVPPLSGALQLFNSLNPPPSIMRLMK